MTKVVSKQRNTVNRPNKMSEFGTIENCISAKEIKVLLQGNKITI